MPRLSTHVLDTAHGRPAAGVPLELRSLDGDPGLVAEGETDGDGRYSFSPAGVGDLPAGWYELTFRVGGYFDRLGVPAGERFLDAVPVRFRMAPGERYHVPLLVAPFGYSSYRGS